MATISYKVQKSSYNASQKTVKVEASVEYSTAYATGYYIYLCWCTGSSSNPDVQRQISFSANGSKKVFSGVFGEDNGDDTSKGAPVPVDSSGYVVAYLYKGETEQTSARTIKSANTLLPDPSVSISVDEETLDGAILDISNFDEDDANSNGTLYFTTAYTAAVVKGSFSYYASCGTSASSITLTGLNSDTSYNFYVYIYDSDWDAYFKVDSFSFTTAEPIPTYTARAYRTNYTTEISAVSPSSSVTVEEGTEQTFSATVNANYIFSGWYSSTSADDPESLNNPYVLKITEDTKLYARAESTKIKTYNLTYHSIDLELYTAYEEHTYYIRVWDNTNERYFIEQRQVDYKTLYNGEYVLDGLSPSTSYSVNIGYKAGSKANVVWIFDSDNTATFTTLAEPRYAIGINYANGIQSGQFWGSDLKSPNMALKDSSVSFSATAKSGYIFYGWYDEDENYLSDANPYTISSIQEDTTLIAKAIPETAFQVSYESIDIQTIGSVTEEAKVYHNSKLLETIDPESNDMFSVSAKIYPSSTYTIKITYDCDLQAAGAVTNYKSITASYEVTTYTPELSASVNNNQVTISLNAGYGTGWSVYFADSNPYTEDTFADLSTSSSKAIFTYLKYNTKYEFHCNYRVASGASYTIKTLSISATTANTSPTYTVSCYKDDATVSSFTKSPNTTFKYRDEVKVTAVAFTGDYQYDYTTPKIYEGSDDSGDLVSSNGTYTYVVIKSVSFYAKGTRTKREYEANIKAEYVSNTSQKITVTNLSSTTGLNSYYYLTEKTSSSPVTSLTSSTSFSRSSGSTTLTGLSAGKHTYYCYVYNSTYGYYYQIGSVTFTAGAKVEYWKWHDETERAAFEGKGEFKVLTASRWKAFCAKFNEIIDAGGYAASLKITIPSNLTSGSALTAEHFNHVTNQIMWFGSAWMNKPEYQQLFEKVNPGDPVLGQYFIDLETAVNDLIDAL